MRARPRSTRPGAWRRSARPASCGFPSPAASSWGSARPSRSGWNRWQLSPSCTPATATSRRSSSRTSCPTSATTVRSPRRSQTRPRASTGARGLPATGPIRRCLSSNGDHISPEHPFPSPHQVRKQLQADGVALTERLCLYPEYIDPEWVAPAVMDTIKVKYWSFIPRRGSGRAEPPAPIRPELVAGAIEKGRDGLALSADELTAMFAETRGEVIEEMRQAADELRAELAGETVTFVVNRNINVSNVCVVGCAFCGFGQGKRSPDAYEHDEQEFVTRIHDAIVYGATELCIQSGIHPDWTLEDYLGWLRLAKRTAAEAGTDLHLHAYSPME